MPTTRPLSLDHIETTVFRLPMHGALQWGKSSRLAEARHVAVRVCLSDGSQGWAEAPPRPTIYGETVHSITAVIAHELAPRVCGLPVWDEAHEGPPWTARPLQAIQARLHEIKNNHTAKAAIDMALHAALAQHRGLSLADHLGAVAARLRVSYILGMGDEESVLAEARRVVDQGVRVLKVKVGRDWQADLARIAKLQAELGPSVDLYADANECLDAATAPALLDRLAELGLHYCEEPLPVEEITARAQLRREGHLPLIADDSAFTLRDLKRELALDTFDILNIKTARTGYTESAAMLAQARQAGKGIMVGSQASAGLGTVCAAHFAALPGIDHPSELSFFLKLQADILDRPLRLENGDLLLAEAAAAQVDPDRLRQAAQGELAVAL
ncbi:MAG TPA: enolase C-terminal domain-like protein [Caldilineaceae bacterium]|nr:enolase C-terminal domain-like protein [Caldilineaceae bacterium]